jgi:hypothetical protein
MENELQNFEDELQIRLSRMHMKPQGEANRTRRGLVDTAVSARNRTMIRWHETVVKDRFVIGDRVGDPVKEGINVKVNA